MPDYAPKQLPERLLSSFGRRKGRRLRTTKQGLFDTLLPKLTLELPEGGLDPAAIFADKSVWLEIGFGGGEHLAHQASLHPEVGIIGCEPYMNGIAGLLKHIDDHKLTNIRIFGDDVRLLMERFPDASLSRAFILYPDPWPKVRHHKRRLVSAEFLTMLARVLKSGSELRLATDDPDYGVWMLERLLSHPDFIWQANDCENWLQAPTDWISTRYEQKALEAGRTPTYFNFKRK